MKKHTNCVHLGIKNKCKFCQYETGQKEHLCRHIKRCHDKIEAVHHDFKQHKCLECEYSGYSLDAMRIHTSRIHVRIKKNKCSFCNYKTSLKKELFQHIKRTHDKIK